MAAVLNGWRGWLLGIAATIIGTLIINGIAFQRETRETLARHSELMKRNQERADNILKYLEQRVAERTAQTERETAILDARLNKALELLDETNKKIVGAPDIGRELFQRDEAIRRLERHVEELEKRR